MQMKKILALVALGFCLFSQLNACLWQFMKDFSRRQESSMRLFPVPHGHAFNTADPSFDTFKEESRLGYELGRFEISIDYGVWRVYEGKYKEAEEIFAKIIKKWPDKYEACANYGTILEVNGKLQDAHKWLQKAIKINPGSHEGTEWLHVKIIEAKIVHMNPVSGAALTGHDFGQETEPKPDADTVVMRALQHALFYQLNERMTFIQPKDPYIAALLFELGNVCLLFNDRKSAHENYVAAERYGLSTKLLKQRKGLAISNKPLAYSFPPLALQAEAPATAEQAQVVQDTVGHRLQAIAPIPEPESPNQQWLLLIALGAFTLALFAIVLVLKYMRRNKV